MKESNGIVFHGKISASEVAQIIQSSKLVIHTESFKPLLIQRVLYSVSTKIADYLASGASILAYGPEIVASIQYLSQNHAAYIVSDPKDLESGIIQVLTDEKLRLCLEKNATCLVEKNHSSIINSKKIYAIVNESNFNENLTNK